MSPLKNSHHTQPQPIRKTETQRVTERVYKGSITKGEKILYSLGAIAVSVLCVIVISNYALLYMNNHQIQQMENQIVQHQGTVDGLSLQVKELSDPDRILRIAQQDLGMSLQDGQVRMIHQSPAGVPD